MPYCVHCGSKHDEGARFCPGCGKPIGQAAEHLVPQPKGLSLEQPAVLQTEQPVATAPSESESSKELREKVRLTSHGPIVYNGSNAAEVVFGLFMKPIAVLKGLPQWPQSHFGAILAGSRALVYAILAVVTFYVKTPLWARWALEGFAPKLFFIVLLSTAFCFALMWLCTWLVAEFVFRTKLDRWGLSNMLGLLGLYHLAAVLLATIVGLVSVSMAAAVVSGAWFLSFLCFFIGLEFVTNGQRSRVLWLTVLSQTVYLLALGFAVQAFIKSDMFENLVHFFWL